MRLSFQPILSLTSKPLTYVYFSIAEGAALSTAPKRTTVQMPDEYLPPNKILFLQNLPQTATKAILMDLFSQYALFPSEFRRSIDVGLLDTQIWWKSV